MLPGLRCSLSRPCQQAWVQCPVLLSLSLRRKRYGEKGPSSRLWPSMMFDFWIRDGTNTTFGEKLSRLIENNHLEDAVIFLEERSPIFYTPLQKLTWAIEPTISMKFLFISACLNIIMFPFWQRTLNKSWSQIHCEETENYQQYHTGRSGQTEN